MKGTIEIIIRKNEDGTFWTEVNATHCKRKDITFAGREAAFISELMKRQGEVQDE